MIIYKIQLSVVYFPQYKAHLKIWGTLFMDQFWLYLLMLKQFGKLLSALLNVTVVANKLEFYCRYANTANMW